MEEMVPNWPRPGTGIKLGYFVSVDSSDKILSDPTC